VIRSLPSLLFFLTVVLGATGRAAERDVVRSFPVSPGCTLVVDTYRGNITVEESERAEIRVAVHLEIGADNEAEAEHMLRSLQLEFAVERENVSVRVRDPAERGIHFTWRDDHRIEPTFRISVPVRCNIDLQTRSGNIVVGSLTGRLAAKAEVGNIFFRRITGSVTAHTETGDVVVSRCSGPVSAEVTSGTVRLGTIGGRCDLRDHRGNIEVLTASAGGTMQAEAGDIAAGFPRELSADATVRTAGGDILIRLDPEASCDLDASSVWGRVRNTVPLIITDGGNDKRRLRGRLHEGGPKVTLHANGGNVRIEPGERVFD
jgi:DUF4097 and DUF4098 domain-containing protein YvlB